MRSLAGNAAAKQAFYAAADSGALHHAWLIAGPQGIGKASFAREAAERLLATSRDGPEQTAAMIEAGSHPRYRELTRLLKDDSKPDGGFERGIKIDQVRKLQSLLARTVEPGEKRVILIDAIDDLERPGASNALLKNLEEPPTGTIFLLVSHAPGRLLPTIRSRCRLLRFDPLSDAEVGEILRGDLPQAGAAEIAALVRAGAGSPGRALRFAGLDLAALEEELVAIARNGDPTNARRVRLSKSLSVKSAQARYEAFLERAPAFLAERAATLSGPSLKRALDAYDAARELARSSLAQSLDVGTTVFQMAGLVARIAPPGR